MKSSFLVLLEMIIFSFYSATAFSFFLEKVLLPTEKFSVPSQ